MLKSCPNCGGKAVFTKKGVSCLNCYLKVIVPEESYGPIEAVAEKHWNRRYPEKESFAAVRIISYYGTREWLSSTLERSIPNRKITENGCTIIAETLFRDDIP